MRTLVERHDWAATPPGLMAVWPASLKTVVTLMLDSTEAMVPWWGEDALQIYTVLLISGETTVRVLGERRRQTLDLLRQRLATVDGLAALDALDAAVQETVRLNPGDLPGATLSARPGPATPRRHRRRRTCASRRARSGSTSTWLSCSRYCQPSSRYSDAGARIVLRAGVSDGIR